MKNVIWTAEGLKGKLQELLKREIHLTLKDNKSVFIHIKEVMPHLVRLTLHSLFLRSSEKICNFLAAYIEKGDRQALGQVKAFAYQHFPKRSICDRQLNSVGRFYDLEEIKERLNKRYFHSCINAKITWFPIPTYKTWGHITLGSYCDTTALIRINTLLDDYRVPPYFISFVVYHEMAHQYVPAMITEKGARVVHSKDFKFIEKQYPYFSLATNWEKDHFPQFLAKKKKEAR